MSRTVALLWAVVAFEMVSPVPAFLSLGAAYVLLARPPWFRQLVEELYAGRGGG